MPEHTYQSAKSRAGQMRKIVEEWRALLPEDRAKVPLSESVVNVVFSAAFDVERLVEEVRRLMWVHEAAEEVLTAAREMAFHESARLVREGGQPFVPNRGAKEAAERWGAVSQKIRDNMLSASSLGFVLDRDAKVKRLEVREKELDARVKLLEKELESVNKLRDEERKRHLGVVDIDRDRKIQVLQKENADLHIAKSVVETRVSILEDLLKGTSSALTSERAESWRADAEVAEDNVRLRRKVNRLIEKLAAEREDVENLKDAVTAAVERVFNHE